MSSNLIDYGKIEDIGLVGVEVTDTEGFDFVLKSRKDGKESSKKLGTISFDTVGITTAEDTERATVATAFSKALSTPNVLESSTRNKLRAHHNWNDVVQLVNRDLPTELQVA